MDPVACIVVDSTGARPGWVLAWQATEGTWRALCRYAVPVDVYTLTREHWLPASALRPR